MRGGGGGYDGKYGSSSVGPGYGAPADAMDFAQNMQHIAGTHGFDLKWRFLFFTCACCVVAAGGIATWSLFVSLDGGMDFIQQIYVLMSGITMFVLDCPWPHNIADQIREVITKYLRFLTLFTGRGASYIFLATMSYAALHDNKISPFLGYCLGGYIFLVGCASLVVGVKRTRALNMLRDTLATDRELMKSALNGQGQMTVQRFIDLANRCGHTFNEEEVEFFFDSYTGGAVPMEDQMGRASHYLMEADLERWLNPVKKEDTYMTVF
jgi:hypothetical protein